MLVGPREWGSPEPGSGGPAGKKPRRGEGPFCWALAPEEAWLCRGGADWRRDWLGLAVAAEVATRRAGGKAPQEEAPHR